MLAAENQSLILSFASTVDQHPPQVVKFARNLSLPLLAFLEFIKALAFGVFSLFFFGTFFSFSPACQVFGRCHDAAFFGSFFQEDASVERALFLGLGRFFFPCASKRKGFFVFLSREILYFQKKTVSHKNMERRRTLNRRQVFQHHNFCQNVSFKNHSTGEQECNLLHRYRVRGCDLSGLQVLESAFFDVSVEHISHPPGFTPQPPLRGPPCPKTLP